MKTRKKTASEKGDVRSELKRHVGVIIEHLDDKIGLVAEQYGDIKKTLDHHTEILDRHSEILDQHSKILDRHTEILDQHSEILDRHSETLKAHTEMIGSILTDIEVIKSDVSFIKGGLKKKVDIEEFTALEKRVAMLERRKSAA